MCLLSIAGQWNESFAYPATAFYISAFVLAGSNFNPVCAKTDILTTLAYFDTVGYPLTQTEIFFFLQHPCCQEEFGKTLQSLQEEGLVFKLAQFYSLQDDWDQVTNRRKSSLRLKKELTKAKWLANLFAALPFVRGVALSGPFAKAWADENGGLHFFILTRKNRLWLTRTILLLLNKLVSWTTKKQLFCSAFFADEEGLQMSQRNIYTATELATLLPLRGIASFEKLYASNTWCRAFLPNHTMKISYAREIKTWWIKAGIELCFCSPLGLALDHLLFKLSTLRGKQEMNCSRHCASNCSISAQEAFLETYENRVASIIRKSRRWLRPVL